jgi:2-hydroxy-3-oxopropionate reductase
MSMQRIGFIGLGIMGSRMTANLMKAGYAVVVHDRVRNNLADALAAGAEEAFSPKDVAQRSDVVITMLPDSPDVEAVALGVDGIIEGVSGNMIYIDMSSIAPTSAVKVAQAMEEQGVGCLDAPVSGGDIGALNATLSIMVGGREDVFEQVKPILGAMGKTITLCGPNGAGQTVKACNQIQVAMNFVGMAEALVLGTKAGVDPAIIVKVLSGGYAQTRVMDVRGPKIVQGDFEPGFKARFHYKDLNIILKTGNDYQVPLPASSLVHELYGAMMAAGRGDLDHSGVITVLEDMAKVEARTRK